MKEIKDEDDEYIPNYILEIEENLDQMYEGRIDKMFVETENGYK